MIRFVILKTISIIVSIVLSLRALCTLIVQKPAKQAAFLQGKIPSKAPDGIYKGSVGSLKTIWVGKEFNAKDSSGINHFKLIGRIIKNYPFKTYKGKGIRDKNIEVIKIDYNLPTNPIWLRFILDEIVEVKPDTFLGKLHIRILPGITFSLGYFMLEK